MAIRRVRSLHIREVKILIDMNLTHVWRDYFTAHGVQSNHWSELGAFSAPDLEIMDFARNGGFVVFTHDLDFGSILAVTNARGPSVIQVRTQDPIPGIVGELVVSAIRDYASHLERGVLLTIEPERLRARVLPMFRSAE
jgi:predicted nuclease of predicted toxin-antitoxin system